MKHRSIFSAILVVLSMTVSYAQDPVTLYTKAMTAYQQKDYTNAAASFTQVFSLSGYGLQSNQLYDGACIYSLNGNFDEALRILHYLADNRFYSNYDHLSRDTDLEKMHDLPGWKPLLEKVIENKRTLPARTRARVRTELLKAKRLLIADNGQLWGEAIWTDNFLVLDPENNLYSIHPFPGSTGSDSSLYTAKAPPNTLSQTNSVQPYNGKDYAIITTGYLADSSATIIHEMFHVLQYSKVKLSGDAIPYLDNYDARQWLRLEYAALKNALQASREKRSLKLIRQMLEDALRYRKLRQSAYLSFLEKEIQIETLEGMANYTGYRLSSFPDKYERAIHEINQRELADTYTRPFPYATGLAYGILFDHLGLKWKTGLDHTYNFLDIYEKLAGKIDTADRLVTASNARSNYTEIHRQELNRKEENEKRIRYYTDMLINQPTLTVKLVNDTFSCSFNMNGTMTLEDKGTIYSRIKGEDRSGKNFGSFSTIDGKDTLGFAGILGSADRRKFVFPLPISIEGNIIKGEFYEIRLSDGWKVQKMNGKGDMEVVRE